MAKKSAAKRIAHLEGICIGAGLLLEKLQARYSASFGEGVAEQVRDCIRDTREVARVVLQREQAGKAARQEGGAA